MKVRKTLVLVAALMVVGIIMSSCRSRQPHCPGVYSKVAPIDKPVQI